MNDVGYHFEALYALEIDFCNEGEEVIAKKRLKHFGLNSMRDFVIFIR